MAMDELALRERIFELLVERTARSGGTITRDELSHFDVDGTERRLIDTSRGIWNPRWLEATLSILSSPNGPYEDQFEGVLLRYAYRAGNDDGDNRKLRRAKELDLPIILLRRLDAGLYLPVFPVYVVKDDPRAKQFLVALDTALKFYADVKAPEVQRRWASRIVEQRLHQPEFRARVVHAYECQCAICGLRHAPLLDAAHITPDAHVDGRATVSNGLSLCKIHHSAYDANLLGITPDRRVVIRQDVLEEEDGPMLKYGIQSMNGRGLILPKRREDRPDQERLAARYAAFLKSA
jgi:putative restriction endonuclease